MAAQGPPGVGAVLAARCDERGGWVSPLESGADFSFSVGVIRGVGGVARKSPVKRRARGIFLKAFLVSEPTRIGRVSLGLK